MSKDDNAAYFRRHRDEGRAKIESGENEDHRLAIDFALDHAGTSGQEFLKAWRNRDWGSLRSMWPEWVPYLRTKYVQFYRADANVKN